MTLWRSASKGVIDLKRVINFINNNILKIFLIIPTLFILFFLVYPLLSLLVQSFYSEEGLTLEYFQKYFSTSLYITVLKNTFTLSLIVAVVCILLGYPIAYAMTKASPTGRIIINTVIQIMYWTSLLVKTYAWIVMMQKQGVINYFLEAIGIIDQPVQLVHTYFGVVCGMSYILLPYMIFSLTPVMQQIDKNLLSASENLGAGSVRTFFKVFLPLTKPGIIAGFSIVFLNSLGYYIVPALLGSEKNTMMSQLIQTQISKVLDWNFAAAISVILIIVTIIVMMITQKISKVKGMK